MPQDVAQHSTCLSAASTGLERTAAGADSWPLLKGGLPTRGCFDGTLRDAARWDTKTSFEEATESQFHEGASDRSVATNGTLLGVCNVSTRRVHPPDHEPAGLFSEGDAMQEAL